MNARHVVEEITRATGRRGGTVRASQLVFGTPHATGQTTVIPVARARVRAGARGGSGAAAGGGVVQVRPLGFITVRGTRADFTPIRDYTRLIQLGLAGVAVVLAVLLTLVAGYVAASGESRCRRGG